MTDTVHFVNLVGQYHRYKTEIDAAIAEVVGSAGFIGGPPVKRFEQAFAEFCGAKFCVGVGNGTDALYLILRSAGIGPGDEVLVPVHTFIATAEAVGMCGARPVFVDVDADYGLIDLASCEKALTKKTKAIMPVHIYGQLADMDAVNAFAEKHGLLVVEDAAQAHGARQKGRRVGTLGKAAGFSFYPGKNLGAYGDGGAVVTDDAALADKVRRIANHGRAEKYGHDMEGVNSRLDGLQASILDAKLRHLDTWSDERRALARRYSEKLKGLVEVPRVRDEAGHVFHLYVIRLSDREGLRKALEAHNIQCGVHYPIPLHLQPAYKHLGHKAGDFPVAEEWARTILSLPMSPDLSTAHQDRVIQAVTTFVEGRGTR